MSQVLPGAARRMNRTVKIEMHVPLSWLPVLIQKMKDGLGSSLFIEAATRILMVCKPACEISSPRQRVLNHRPRVELQSHSAFAVNILDSLHEMPEFLSA